MRSLHRRGELRLPIDHTPLNLNHEEARPHAIDTSSVTLLVQDSGEDRGEAGDGGVGVAGQPEKRLKTRNDPVRATQGT